MNETEQLEPNSKEIVSELVRRRWGWRLLAALFFMPALFFMVGPEKKITTALETGDVELAKEALESMRVAALIAVPIGTVIIMLRFV